MPIEKHRYPHTRAELKAYWKERRAIELAHNQLPEVKARTNARQNARNQRPEVKAKIRAYRQRPKVRERLLNYYARPEIKEKQRKNERRRAYARKIRVFEHYGGSPPKCACCGETHLEFLSLDHINGGGNKHRKEVGFGSQLYSWLIKNKFPSGFQVLCFNCNCAKGFFGYCPHQKEKKED